MSHRTLHYYFQITLTNKTELAHPGLFSSLVLCEPILFEQDVDPGHTFHLSERALKRKSLWQTREEAEEYLKARPMFSSKCFFIIIHMLAHIAMFVFSRALSLSLSLKLTLCGRSSIGWVETFVIKCLDF
jgi:hypothetical protein